MYIYAYNIDLCISMLIMYIYASEFLYLSLFLLVFFDFCLYFDQFGGIIVDLGSLFQSLEVSWALEPSGTILAPSWNHFGSILAPSWVHFGSILGPFWLTFGIPGGISRACFFFVPFLCLFGLVLGLFGWILGAIWGPKTDQK